MKKRNLLLLAYSLILFSVFSCAAIRPEKDESILGLTELEVISSYGEPDTAVTFILKDSRLYEECYNLSNIFPTYKTDTIEIKQMYWDGMLYETLVWLHQKDSQWVVVDNLKWGRGVQF